MEPADIRQFLSETTPFSYLDDAQLTQTLKHIRVFYCAEGDRIEIPDDRLMIVRSGAFSSLDPDGHRNGELLPGDVYGHDRLLGLDSAQKQVICEDDGLIFWLSDKAFHECRKQSAHVAGYFHGLARQKLHRHRGPQSSSRFTLKVGDVIDAKKVVISPNATVMEAAKHMTTERVSSLLILSEEKLVGIVTDRDLRSRVLAKGLPATTVIQDVMSPSPHHIDKRAYLFEAVLTMGQHNIHHLPVMDGQNSYGMITLTDIVRVQQNHPVFVIGDLHRQTDVDGLKRCMSQLSSVLQELAQVNAPAHEVSHIITTATDALTQRLIYLAQQKLGPAPIPFCWIAFGSQARMDQSINADQDNALILQHEPDKTSAHYFHELTEFVCQSLDACGIVLCPGNIMASNPELRLSLNQWGNKIAHITHSPSPESILKSSIYFDFRAIAGEMTLADQLRRRVLELTRQNDLFLYHLTQSALERTPPLSMLKNFVMEHDAKHNEQGVDLKKRGISLITDLVRVYALAYGIGAANTRQRLQQLMQLRHLDRNDAQNLLDAFDVLSQLRWQKHQKFLNESYVSNLVDPDTLSVLQRHQMKDSFNVINTAQNALKLRFARSL